jgi:hypothetical protein
MKRIRKRAPGAGRPPGEQGTKSSTFSLRVPPDMWIALSEAAKRNKRRSTSEEIVQRLRGTLIRDRSDADRPRHIRALSETIARTALGVEQKTERAWIENRYTAEQLLKAITLFIHTYSHGDNEIPPAVTAAVEALPAEIRDTYDYAARLGESVASGIISLMKSTPAPPKQEWPVTSLGYQIYYPESWWGPWQLEQDLKPTPKSRRKK